MSTSIRTEDVTKVTSFTYTSTKIRYLLSKGYSRGQISKHLNIIYQHVYNESKRVVKHPKETF